MSQNALSPENCFALQIELDHLHTAAERCRDGLHALRRGGLSREDYERLFNEQREAQSRWELSHRRLFGSDST